MFVTHTFVDTSSPAPANEAVEIRDALLAQGYSGRALGMELERQETEIFRRLGA